MIAQQHQRLVAQIRHQALALVMIQRQPLIAVIGDLVLQQAGVLADRQKALLLGRDADAVHRVQMDDEMRLFAGRMDRRMDGETRRIDEAGRVLNDIAVQIDFYQGRRCNFIEIPAVGINQKVMLRSRHAGRDMGEDHVVPPVERHQTIESRQFDPRLPLRLGHLGLQRGCVRHRPSPLISVQVKPLSASAPRQVAERREGTENGRLG